MTNLSPALCAVRIERLRFGYARDRVVLDIPAWHLARAERVFLMGPSGSGKSTLLNLLMGLRVPDQGELQVLGQSLPDMSQRQRDRFRARHLGFVMQQFNLVPYLSVLDNLLLASHFSRSRDTDAPKDAMATRAAHLLAQLHVSGDLLHRQAGQLSVGQQQRVAIARAMINRPELIIVDEPTSALDMPTADAFVDLLLDLCQQSRAALIFVSHSARWADRFDRVQTLDAMQAPSPEGAEPQRG